MSNFMKSSKNIGRLLKSMAVTNPILAFGTFLVFTLSSVMLSLQLVSISKVVDAVSKQDIRTSVYWATALIISFISITIIDLVKPLFELNLREAVTFRYQYELSEKALGMPVLDFDTPSFYDKLTRAKEDSQMKMAEIFEYFFTAVLSVFNVVSILLVLIYVSPWIILLITICAIPGFIYTIKTGKKTHFANRYRTPEWRLHYYLNRLLGTKENSKEVRILGISHYLYEMWSKLGNRIRDETRDIEIRHAQISIFTNLLSKVSVLASMIILVIMIALSQITLGAIALTLQATRQFQENLFNMLQSLSKLFTHSLFIGDVYEFLDSSSVAAHAHAKNSKRIKGIKEIEFRDVSFQYEGSDQIILDKISFKWKIGERIALVGENGAGKSTFVKLLLGMYEPTSGSVLVNGIDLKECEKSEYYTHVTATFQDFVKYQMSLRENISFNKDVNEDTLNGLLKKVGLVNGEHFSKNLETKLGTEYGGEDLSGGQWQKLAIARSLFPDTDMIILDEPTASLDAISEVEIFNKFSEISKEKGVLMISHRLGSARLADRILFIGKGQILEEGSHEDLMNKGISHYKTLFKMQAEWYRNADNTDTTVVMGQTI